jgi:hypothetical protein
VFIKTDPNLYTADSKPAVFFFQGDLYAEDFFNGCIFNDHISDDSKQGFCTGTKILDQRSHIH